MGVFFALALFYRSILPEASGNTLSFCFLIGLFTELGVLLVYIAVDVLDQGTALAKLGRIILGILAGILIFGCGVVSLFFYAIQAERLTTTSPWVCAFGGQWLLNGILAAMFLRFMDDDENAIVLAPFVQLAALFVGYLVYVIFAYLGQYVHTFFYGWILLIIIAAGLILLIVLVIKGILDFDEVSLPGFGGNKSYQSSKAKHITATIKDIDDNEPPCKNGIYQLLCGNEYYIFPKLSDTAEIPPMDDFDINVENNDIDCDRRDGCIAVYCKSTCFEEKVELTHGGYDPLTFRITFRH
ncbi:MAG: hypothetical protein K2J01_05445 [Clostridiales bacterium]|nr:hypothetical protein [Clostridiales bacterium]